MFGHRKGAFTGAVRDKPGLLEAANGGTLFLDELIEMSTPIQAKLLRAIQDGIVRRVGSETTDAVVNVRFIAATNGDAEAALKAPAVDANPASLVSTLLKESYHAARDRVIAQFERQYLTWLVNRVGGNMSKAARIAGVDRTTLYRLMGRHGLQRSPSTGWVIEREPTEDEAVVPTGGAPEDA